MRHTLIPLKVVFLLTIFCLTGNLSHAAVNPKPFVIPELKQWTGKEGSFIPGTDAKSLHFLRFRTIENCPYVCR